MRRARFSEYIEFRERTRLLHGRTTARPRIYFFLSDRVEMEKKRASATAASKLPLSLLETNICLK
jgi:hypothetical protein